MAVSSSIFRQSRSYCAASVSRAEVIGSPCSASTKARRRWVRWPYGKPAMTAGTTGGSPISGSCQSMPTAASAVVRRANARRWYASPSASWRAWSSSSPTVMESPMAEESSEHHTRRQAVVCAEIHRTKRSEPGRTGSGPYPHRPALRRSRVGGRAVQTGGTLAGLQHRGALHPSGCLAGRGIGSRVAARDATLTSATDPALAANQRDDARAEARVDRPTSATPDPQTLPCAVRAPSAPTRAAGTRAPSQAISSGFRESLTGQPVPVPLRIR